VDTRSIQAMISQLEDPSAMGNAPNTDTMRQSPTLSLPAPTSHLGAMQGLCESLSPAPNEIFIEIVGSGIEETETVAHLRAGRRCDTSKITSNKSHMCISNATPYVLTDRKPKVRLT
jgi:hypothetical protein